MLGAKEDGKKKKRLFNIAENVNYLRHYDEMVWVFHENNNSVCSCSSKPTTGYI